MPVDLYVRKFGDNLQPLDELAAAEMAKIPSGKPLKASVVVPRSIPHQRLYHALLQLVSDNFEHMTKAGLEQAVKQALGYSRVFLRKGATITMDEAQEYSRQMLIINQSTGFDKMSQSDFTVFTDLAVRFLIEEVVPGMTPQVLDKARSMIYEDRARSE